MVRIKQFSEKGGTHSKNEDFISCSPHFSGATRKIAFLADGQGGRPDGDIASRVACESGFHHANSRPWDELEQSSTWDDVFSEIDQSVQDACDGCTTLIALAFSNDSLIGASVGDSKVFFLDSTTEELLELTDRQQKNPPIGAGCNRATPFTIPMAKGTVLVVSDGVWKFVSFESLKAAAEEPDLAQASLQLKNSILSKSSSLPDDYSILALRFE